MNKDLLNKAKGARSAAELKAIAAAAGTELTDEQAEAYYDHFGKTGALTDEELDNVAGGGCNAKDGRLIVTVGYRCSHWVCKKCGSSAKNAKLYLPEGGYDEIHACAGTRNAVSSKCGTCKYMSYENCLWLCNRV